VIISYPHIELRSLLDAGEETLKDSPFITGSNVPVRRLWTWWKRGTPAETLVKRYPQLGPAKVLSALAFAHDNRELVERDEARAERALNGDRSCPS
jgi:uncharacterized protein (DUF433 family)